MKSKAQLFDTDLTVLAGQAKALAHPARLKVLRVLARRESCICGDIVEDLPLAQATVSRHLKTLKEAGLIQGEIDGPRVCYCLDRKNLERLQDQIDGFLTGVLEPSETENCC
jgi:ArsR family transcriptional regulator